MAALHSCDTTVPTTTLENAKLVTSFDVQGNCSGETCAQKLHQCQQGGRCVDRVQLQRDWVPWSIL